MTQLKQIYRIIAILLVMPLVLSGCEDDMFQNSPDYYPEGETTVTIEARFEPFAGATVGSRDNVTPGTAMDQVSDVCLLAYDADGNLMEGFPKELTGYSVDNEKRTDSDASNGVTAQATTQCLKKTNVELPYGSYYLIAVANLGKYANNGSGGIKTETSTLTALNTAFKGQYETLDDLRRMRVAWDRYSYRNSRQMLGYFVSEGSGDDGAPGSQSSFQRVQIRKSNSTVRCWLRRVASKVTVDIDGTGLRENVNVYVNKVTIHNVAKTATLGFGKKAPETESDEWQNFNNTSRSDDDNDATTEHSVLFYGGTTETTDHNQWPHIAKGTPYIVNPDGSRKDMHSESADSLFAFENMQGDAPNGKYQQADLVDGGVANSGSEFDELPYGTYIEVEAYYEASGSDNISKGKIYYRFMLGKDVESNCDFERNYHYKITLRLLGNANDYDWHVDYKETEGWEAPNPWYVSYLYNHKSTLPFKYTPKQGYEVIKVSAEIIHNPWEADNPATWKMDPNDSDTLAKIIQLQAGFAPPNDNLETYQADNKYLGNGFLSLRETDKVVVTEADCGGASFGYNYESRNYNNKYFLGQTGDKKINRAVRTYYDRDHPDNVETQISSLEDFTMVKDPDGNKVTMNIPLFTRAKVLVKKSGYSGNNPFVGYTRTARIRLDAVSVKQKSDGTADTLKSSYIVPVVQVRRIVNPKGVYRRSGNHEDFHVKLMHLPGDDANAFKTFASDGPWKAEILGDRNFITLDGKQTVSGSTNDSIEFTIRFNKLNNDDVVRNAVVRVLYHNYSCTHLIFVRQGYKPQQITDNAISSTNEDPVYWNTCNMISQGCEALDPRDEGSLFKYGNVEYPIDAVNNVYYDNDGLVDCHAPSTFGAPATFKIAKAETGDIKTSANTTGWTDPGWTGFKKKSEGFKSVMPNVATINHFEQIYRTKEMQYGYGVLYADGATETQVKYNDAYGYYRRDPENKKDKDGNVTTDSHKGMRGMFVYYYDSSNPGYQLTGKNVFFPIGRAGYGHRKQGDDGKELESGKGYLRYSCRGFNYRGATFNIAAPLFASLFHRPGAIYYARTSLGAKEYKQWNDDDGEGVGFGLDINYFSFDVNAITATNLDDGEDACFVRCVTPASEMTTRKTARRRR